MLTLSLLAMVVGWFDPPESPAAPWTLVRLVPLHIPGSLHAPHSPAVASNAAALRSWQQQQQLLKKTGQQTQLTRFGIF
jgi:hypothetical protein